MPNAHRRPRLVPLVLCAAASQAQLVVLTPTAPAAARDLAVSIGTVGQARSVTALTAIATSVLLARRPDVRVPGVPGTPGPLAAAGALAGLTGCLAVAFAPGLGVFLLAHVLVGVGVAALLTAAFGGVAAYPRSRQLSVMGWVTAGGGLAWVVVAPSVGLVTERLSWRAAELVPGLAVSLALLASPWLVAPWLGASWLGAPATPSRAPTPTAVLRDPAARRWVVGESVAYAAWTGVLTFVGAYLADRFDVGETRVGLILATGAGGYAVASTRVGLLGRRWSNRRLVVASAAAMSLLVPALLGGPVSAAGAAGLFLLLGLAAGIRTPSSAALGLEQLDGDGRAMMAARTGATQGGYLLGALVGGAVIATSGYGLLGILLAAGLLASAGVLARVPSTAAPSLVAPRSAAGDRRRGRGPAGPSGEAELGVGVGQVPLHGAVAEEQPGADLPVRQAVGHQAQHLLLPGRQRRQPCVLPGGGHRG